MASLDALEAGSTREVLPAFLRAGFGAEFLCMQPGIQAAQRQQLRMAALFDHADEDSQCGQSVHVQHLYMLDLCNSDALIMRYLC